MEQISLNILIINFKLNKNEKNYFNDGICYRSNGSYAK